MTRACFPLASIELEHPHSRSHHRQPLTAASCSCTHYWQCSTDPGTCCDCIDSGRHCYNCNPRDKCQNCLYTDPPLTTGLLDPAIGLLCLLGAEMLAHSCRLPVTQLTETTWAFDAPATPGSQNTHLTILIQAQSQELKGSGNSTQHGTQPLTSPHEEAGGSSAPKVLFVF